MAQTFRLAGAVVLLTGAASGIGAALAQGLAAKGCSLLLVDRDAAGLATVAGKARATGAAVETQALDLADAEAIKKLPDWAADRFGRLDVLINNAGVALGGRFDESHLEDFEWLMDINLRAVVRMCHAFLPMLKDRPAAQIVNLSSLFGLIAPPGQVAYATSKFGVRGFTEALRHEYAGTGLGVTVVHPGGVATAIARSARGTRPPTDPEAAERARVEDEKAREAFGKLLTLSPEEAAAAIIQGIERRRPRILIGKDAKSAALIQRLMPVGYWKTIMRLSAGRSEMASLRAYIGTWMVRTKVRGPLSKARDAAAFRRIFEAPAFPDPKGVTYEPGTVGGVRGEWVRPKSGPGQRMLYLHGGGFIACSPRTHRPVTGALANRGFTIFVPDYRLAPEHPFPAAIEDVTAVWQAFGAEGPACIAGESAGANMALVLIGEARARGLPMPWAAALFSPATDFVSEDGSRRTNAWRDAMFDPGALAVIRTMYLGTADPADPRISPINADPTGYPPLLFHVGEREVLRDDSIRMAEKARAAGVVTELKLFPVVAHAWQFAAHMLPEARASLDGAAAFLKAHAPPNAAASTGASR